MNLQDEGLDLRLACESEWPRFDGMKFFLAIASCWFSFVPWLAAQVTVDLVLDQEQYLPNETLVIGVRVTNFSGQTLHLGKEPDWLKFSVEAQNNHIVAKLDEVPVVGEFDLESSNVATKRIDLAPYFRLTKPGRYTVTASVSIRQMGREISSKSKFFDIISGAKLWEQEFGMPRPLNDASGQPEIRKYILQQALHLKQLKLYVRVTDASESRVFRVFPIGPLVSFSRPELQVDKFSNLHVLNQYGAKSFNYCVINPDGETLARQTYEYTNTRPVLKTDKEGKIIVAGGVRRVTSADLPASNTTAPTPDVKPPKP